MTSNSSIPRIASEDERDDSLEENGPTTPLLSTENTQSNESSETNEILEGSADGWLRLLMAPLTDDKGGWKSVLAGLCAIFFAGTVIGIVLPKDPNLPNFWVRVLSNCVGYTYFMSWSISFYPQLIANYRRRSTEGLSVDFCALNVVGFGCYSIYNVSMYSSPYVHRLYKERYGEDAEISVQSNDVAFAVHALLLSTLTLIQIGYYDGIRSWKPTPVILKVIIGILVVSSVFPLVLYTGWFKKINYLDYLYLLSFVKILVSCIKYVPQVFLNYRRKSTNGWSIWQILLDFNGGMLSDLQLVLDCWALNDFTGISGNLAKLCLGSVSVVFDIVFMTQHYILYPASESVTVDEEASILETDEDEGNESDPEPEP